MIPVGDFTRRRTTPYVNWALIVLNFLVFFYTLSLSTRPDLFLGDLHISEADRFLFDWGFEPACVAHYFGFTTQADARQIELTCSPGDRTLVQLFSAMFVHAGWAHIFANMLFLWIFGDNVEDRVGHLRYVGFYLLCGLGAAALQILLVPNAIGPSVGASGAVAGVLGAYLVLYPTAMVQVVILPFFFVPFFLPAVAVIGTWFALQLFSGLAELGQHTAAGSGVAWWAHVGGFAAGVVLIWLLKRAEPRPPPRLSIHG